VVKRDAYEVKVSGFLVNNGSALSLGGTHYRYRNKNITIEMIKKNAPSGAKEIRKTKQEGNLGTSLGPGLVGGAKNSAPPTHPRRTKQRCMQKIGINKNFRHLRRHALCGKGFRVLYMLTKKIGFAQMPSSYMRRGGRLFFSPQQYYIGGEKGCI
jgi:hypothetical protein